MSEKQIIFTRREPIERLLAGKITVTMRLPKVQPTGLVAMSGCRYHIGDTVWVREPLVRNDPIGYVDFEVSLLPMDTQYAWRWKRPRLPAIFMPKKFCRIQATVDVVKVVRVQDAIKLGLRNLGLRRTGFKTVADYEKAFDELNARRGFTFADNPWVHAIVLKPKRAAG